MPADPAPAAAPRVDLVALARTRQRLLRDATVPWLHQEAARRMAARLPIVKLQPGRVIDWSGPLGVDVPLLRAAYPKARLQVVTAEGSPHPSAAAGHRRWWPLPRSAPRADETPAAGQLDAGRAELVWSNMALHAQADPAAAFAAWHRALAPGGFLMFSTLGPGTLAELRAIYRERSWGPPMADLIDMHDLGDALVRAGFSDPVMDQETLTLSWPDVDRLLAELRGWGANLSPWRHAGLRGREWKRQLTEALQAPAQAAGRPALSVELVYGHAFRGAERPDRAGETGIPLETVRQQLRRADRHRA